jgi:hypothetical protein
MTRDEIARIALGERSSAGGMHTTSDFPALLSNITGKFIVDRLQVNVVPYMEFYSMQDAPDFKKMSFIKPGSLPKLVKLPQGGEIKRGTMSESEEEGQLETFARGLVISRPMIVNDDLGRFATLLTELGDVVAENREDIVMRPFREDITLLDGDTFFSVSKGNDLTTYGQPSVSQIEAVGALFSAQADTVDAGPGKTAGRRRNRRPTHWLAAYLQSITLEKLLTPTYVPQVDTTSLAPRFRGQTVLQYDRLDEQTARPYFAIDSRQSGLVCGSLQGSSGPTVKQQDGFWNDGIEIVVQDDFFAAITHRGGVVRAHVTDPS